MLELALSEARAAAGSVVHGRVARDRRSDPRRGRARARRAEPRRASRATTWRAPCAADDGAFELAVPDDAPPDVEGRECSLHYAVRASRVGDEVLRGVLGRALIRAVACPSSSSPASARRSPSDFVASFSGRRMHVELAHADLRGGGRIEGRVARRPRAGTRAGCVASVRCIESWRVSPRPGRWILHESRERHPAVAPARRLVRGARRARAARRRALARVLVRASRRAAAGGRGALDRLALRGRGAALGAARPGRSGRASRRSATSTSTCSRAPRADRPAIRTSARATASRPSSDRGTCRSPSRAPARGTRPTRRASRR